VPYRFIEEAPTADVGFAASGATLEECFQAAADATLEVMLANPDSLEPRDHRAVRVQAESVDLALLRFLEELVFYKDAEGLFLRATNVRVWEDERGWQVDAVLEGERIDPARHQLSGDVKAVTLHRLRVQPTPEGWEATVVLDV
jgi:SHS2 domain-containing protein